MSTSDWRKSSFSNPEHACVEVALGGAAGVRDSKSPGGGVLVFDSRAWEAFRSLIKRA
jgi:hypothetical protein